MNKKNMDWNKVKRKYPKMNPNSDADFDGLVNSRDCRPLDPAQDGLFGRAIGVVTGGKFGQSAEDYASERELKRDVAEDIEERTITQQAKEPTREAIARQTATMGELTEEEQDAIRLKMEQKQRFARSKTGRTLTAGGKFASFVERGLEQAASKRRPTYTAAQIKKAMRKAPRGRLPTTKRPKKRKAKKPTKAQLKKIAIAKRKEQRVIRKAPTRPTPVYRAPTPRLPTSVKELYAHPRLRNLLPQYEKFRISQLPASFQREAAINYLRPRLKEQEILMKRKEKQTRQSIRQTTQQRVEISLLTGKPTIIKSRGGSIW